MSDPYGDQKDRRQRWDALDEADRRPLLDAAEEEFARRGFEGASFNAILKMAGRSKGSVYYYVSGKEDLYALMCERVFARLLERLGPLEIGDETPDAFWCSVGDYIDRFVGILVTDERIATVGRGVYDSPRAEAAVASSLEKLKIHLRHIAEAGQRAGAIREDLPKDLIISALMASLLAMDRWFAENLMTYTPDEAQVISTKAMTMLRNLARPDQENGHA